MTDEQKPCTESRPPIQERQESDNSGHVHRIGRFLPANVHGHSHDLTAEKPKREPAAAKP